MSIFITVFLFFSFSVHFVAAVRKTRRSSRRRRRRRRARRLKSTPLHRNTKVRVWCHVVTYRQEMCHLWLKCCENLTDLDSFLSSPSSSSFCLSYLPYSSVIGVTHSLSLSLSISNHRFQMNRWPVRPLTGPQWLKSVLLCRASAIWRVRKVTIADPRRHAVLRLVWSLFLLIKCWNHKW